MASFKIQNKSREVALEPGIRDDVAVRRKERREEKEGMSGGGRDFIVMDRKEEARHPNWHFSFAEIPKTYSEYTQAPTGTEIAPSPF